LPPVSPMTSGRLLCASLDVIYKPVTIQDIRPRPVGCAGFFGGMGKELPGLYPIPLQSRRRDPVLRGRVGFRLHWREDRTAVVSSGRKITEAEAVRAAGDMVYAQHQVSWALGRLCELGGARWGYDSNALGAIRRECRNPEEASIATR
jgi:hypothetical protein